MVGPKQLTKVSLLGRLSSFTEKVVKKDNLLASSGTHSTTVTAHKHTQHHTTTVSVLLVYPAACALAHLLRFTSLPSLCASISCLTTSDTVSIISSALLAPTGPEREGVVSTTCARRIMKQVGMYSI